MIPEAQSVWGELAAAKADRDKLHQLSRLRLEIIEAMSTKIEKQHIALRADDIFAARIIADTALSEDLA